MPELRKQSFGPHVVIISGRREILLPPHNQGLFSALGILIS